MRLSDIDVIVEGFSDSSWIKRCSTLGIQNRSVFLIFHHCKWARVSGKAELTRAYIIEALSGAHVEVLDHEQLNLSFDV